MGSPTRLAFVLAVVALAPAGYAQDAPKPPAGPGRSPDWILQVQADADFEFADWPAALAAARAVLDADGRFPKDVRARAMRIQFRDAHSNRRKAEAATILTKLRELCPDDPEAGLRHLQQAGIHTPEDIPARIRELEGLLDRVSPYPPALKILTDLLVLSGRAADARRKVEAAMKGRRPDALLLAARAAALHAQGEHRKALEDLDAALACEPPVRYVDTLYSQRAEVLHALHRPDEALAYCALALHLKPPHLDEKAYVWEVFQIISRCYQSLGKFELAYFCARPVAKFVPQEPDSWRVLADACVFSGRYAEGQRALDKLAALGPLTPRAHWLRARLRAGLGDEAGALAAVRDGRKVFPDDRDLALQECSLLATARADTVRDGKRARELAAAALAGPGGADPKWVLCAAVAHAAAEDYAAADDLLAKAEAATATWDGALRRSLLETREQIRKRERITDRMPDPVPDAGEAIRTRTGWHTEVTAEWDLELMPIEMGTGYCLKVAANEALDVELRSKAVEVLTRLWHRAGEIPRARHGYKALVQLDPKNPAYRRGQVAADVVDLPPADQAAAWERFCAEFPGDLEGRANWGYELQRAGDLARSDEVLAVCRREAPDHPRVLHLEALGAMRRANYAAAVGLADRWLRRPDQRGYHALAYVVRAEALTRLGRFDAALADLAVAQRLAPNRPFLGAICRTAGRCYLHQDKYVLAAQVAERWAGTGVNPAESNLLAATAALLGGDLEGAASRLDGLQPASLSPLEVDLRRAVLNLRRGDHAGCREALERGLGVHPESEPTRCALAVHLTFAPDGKARDARRALELAGAGVTSGSGLKPVWAVALANAHAELGELDKAVEVLDTNAADLDPGTRKSARAVFEARQALRHDHDLSKWAQKQLLLDRPPEGR